MSPVLICSGFHRSATSVTAKLLNRAGLHMGTDLMKPNIANPSGYYEDMPVVQLHDDLLRNSDHFRDYVKARDAISPSWGFKDPRALLFLISWDEALSDRGRYLF